MSSLGVGLVVLALAASLVPLWLLRRTPIERASDWLVAPGRLRAPVVRNASVATTMRALLLAVFFIAGASGQAWATLSMAASLGAGVWLAYRQRRPMLAHLDGALARDASFSLVALAARRFGPDRRLRRLAAGLVLMALGGLVVVEALVVREGLEWLLARAPSPAGAIAAGLVLVAAVQALGSGHAAALHAAQLQLGLIHIGVFGCAVLLLYAQASTLVPLGGVDAMMLAIVAAAFVFLIAARRSRYVDSDTIRPLGLPSDQRASLASRALRRWAKLANQVVSTLVVVAIVIAGMALYGAGSQGLQAPPVPGGGLPQWLVAALCVVFLLHPLVDLAMWQQVTALRSHAGPNDLPGEEAGARLRTTFRAHAMQVVVLAMIAASIGSLAAVVTGARSSGAVWTGTASRLAVLDADLGGGLVPFALLAMLACALSTMAAQFSAMLATWRLDIATRTATAPADGAHAVADEEPRRRAARRVVLVLACLVAAVSAVLPFPGAAPDGSVALLVLVVLGCGQLLLLPATSQWRNSSSAGDAGTPSGHSR